MTQLGALPTRRVSMVATLLVAVLVTLVPSSPPLAHADAGTESAFVAATNQTRAAAGLGTLSVAGDLTAVARSHSTVMADGVNLHHNPDLGSDVSGWLKVGENVGRGPSVTSIQDAFMASPSHRRNILDDDWSQIGIGVIVRDGTIWVTVLFRQPAGSPAPVQSPAPAAAVPEAASEQAAAPAPAAATDTDAPDDSPEQSPEDAATDAGPTDAEPIEQAAAEDAFEAPALAHDRIQVTMAKLEASER